MAKTSTTLSDNVVAAFCNSADDKTAQKIAECSLAQKTATCRSYLTMKLIRFIAAAMLLFLAMLANADDLRTEPLEPNVAFQFSASVDGDDAVIVYRMPEGIYLYRNHLQLTTTTPDFTIGELQLPAAEVYDDPFFGKTEVYYTAVTAHAKINGYGDFELVAISQGCDEQVGICYPPRSDIALLHSPAITNGDISGGIADKAGEATKIIENSGLFFIVIGFFGLGLLLSFTPCVLPMVPILLGIISGDKGRRRASILTVSYASGSIIAFTLLGVLAGFSGQLLSVTLQRPPALIATAVVFVVLALSMLGNYELRLPWRQRLSALSDGGKIGGAFVMGFFSAVALSPCVAAPLVGALVYIGKTQDAALGAVALASLALGMNTLIIAAGLTSEAILPKSGKWLEEIKRFLGILLLAVAVWVLSPLLSTVLQMLFYGVILIALGTHLRALDRLPSNASFGERLAKTGGLSLLLWGIIMLTGAASGGRDVLLPLSHLSSTGGEAGGVSSQQLQFRTVKSIPELEKALATANGRPVMLEFYADWCVSCKEFERFTLSDRRVQARLRNALLLRADVSESNNAQQQLLKRFGLFGPPAVLFYSRSGELNENIRVIGHEPPNSFLKILDFAKIVVA